MRKSTRLSTKSALETSHRLRVAYSIAGFQKHEVENSSLDRARTQNACGDAATCHNDDLSTVHQKDSRAMSNEYRLDIVRRMLLDAPPGQLDTLAEDFRAIFAACGEALDEEWLNEVRADHLRATSNLDGGEETPRAKELYESLKKYQVENYSSNGVTSALSVKEEGDLLVIRTFAGRIDNSNCQAGSWASHWTLQPSDELSGKVQVRALCYEEGNIQLHSTRDFGPATCVGEAKVIERIGIWEQQVMDGINEMYDDMGGTLRSLRRVMPITRTKMDWNVLSHRMVKLLGDTKE